MGATELSDVDGGSVGTRVAFTAVKAKDYHNVIAKSLTEVYETKEYCDLVVICGGRAFNVHKLVMCAQSDFFKKACSSTFEEGEKGVITLQDHDPALVHLMIHQMYTGHYTTKSVMDHVSLYAMADEYLIPTLKTVAVSKLQLALADFCVADFFTEPYAKEIFNNTPKSDRGMRHAFKRALEQQMFKEKQSAIPQAFYETYGRIPELGVGMFQRVRDRYLTAVTDLAVLREDYDEAQLDNRTHLRRLADSARDLDGTRQELVRATDDLHKSEEQVAQLTAGRDADAKSLHAEIARLTGALEYSHNEVTRLWIEAQVNLRRAGQLEHERDGARREVAALRWARYHGVPRGY